MPAENIDLLDFTFLPPEVMDKITTTNFKKGDIIETAGSVSKRLYFIQTGLLRVFYYKEGKDITCYFAKEGDPITGIDSFFTQTPTKYNIEVLEDSTCISLTKDELDWMYANIPGMDTKGRIFMTNSYIAMVERFNSVLFQTADEKYKIFEQQYNDILLRAPLGHIATYLGMSQETLSRVRAKK